MNPLLPISILAWLLLAALVMAVLRGLWNILAVYLAAYRLYRRSIATEPATGQRWVSQGELYRETVTISVAEDGTISYRMGGGMRLNPPVQMDREEWRRRVKRGSLVLA